ncbi:zinc ABC transporter substrate-binding protein [Companilactobacillus crustorum]|uniref:metal ABC transporter solute-binding protein, Zn/Mn family n=1 Tax=Companilactobacillus crustorum TaxID=392416 RepID=UPI000ED40F35|nr:zinc ABC transporter substrate-binding protein [Companilactobacillus crustorum]WDT65396.1 zinc ABC transporter substrate-binding protein [Companilactobacillus crustorum]HCD07488.1 zinc ABC transporter substrate-binding protein [Lactobacillus sp.]
MRKRKVFLFVLFSLLIFVGGCSQKKSSQKIITTTVNTYIEPIKSVVGNKYKVESIIKSVNVDPHSFSPSSNDAKQIADSKIIVSSGLGYDDWVNKIVTANSQNKNLIDFADVLHKKDGDNEHIWFGVQNIQKLSQAVYQRMIKVDPKNKAYYQANFKEYDLKLASLIQREKALKKYTNGKKAYVTEPLPYYMLKDLGVTIANQHFAKAVEDDTDPSIDDVKDMENGLKKHQVSFLVVNKQVTSGIITKMTDLAKKYHVPIVYFTETLPNDLGYYDWMDGNITQIERIVKK